MQYRFFIALLMPALFVRPTGGRPVMGSSMDDVDNLDEEDFPAIVGIDKDLFDYVYEQYCGPHTPIRSRYVASIYY